MILRHCAVTRSCNLGLFRWDGLRFGRSPGELDTVAEQILERVWQRRRNQAATAELISTKVAAQDAARTLVRTPDGNDAL